ncbi:F-box protein skip23 [Rhynchospora pubera]|uniref:F-box protein skip23 n=1 Tax=Rhynchospora pubera TaxID=906938 RepID=A0AAV8H8W3_9POAL|nr:F-box protein skip23 [Rhynchospora pubera]
MDLPPVDSDLLRVRVQDHPLRNRDWSNLQDDIARLIAKKLWFYPHHRKFAVACADWYRITKEVHGPFQQNSIVLLLPYNNESEICALYKLSDSRTYEFSLSVLDGKFIYGSSNGWVCLDDKDYSMKLINLLTMKQFELPYPSYALDFIGDRLNAPFIKADIMSKIAVSGSPLSSNDCIIAAIMSTFEELLICRLGDKSWNQIIIKESKLKSYNCGKFLNDVIFLQGKIYAINGGCALLIVDFDGSNYVARETFGPCYQAGDAIGHPSRCESCIEGLYMIRLYLAGCSGKLLAVRRLGKYFDDDGSFSTQYFELFEFEESKETWRMIHEIGGESLFVGQNESISVSATDIPGCRPNCIYFTDDFYRGQLEWEFGFLADNGVFCCQDGTVERFPISHPMERWMVPAMWCQLKI